MKIISCVQKNEKPPVRLPRVELQAVLGYTEWRNFEKVIEKAKLSCETAGGIEISHFVDVNKMVSSGVADIPIKDIMLSRYACYLIAQNGDPRKKVIAAAQSYFATQTRRQELQDNFEQLTEDQRRLAIRQELKGHNASLAEAAKNAKRSLRCANLVRNNIQECTA